MLITLEVTLAAPGAGITVATSLKDALNKARAAKNVYPKIGNFCKYLSLQAGGSSSLFVAGSPEAIMADAGLFVQSNEKFILEDMRQGRIPLGDIYLVTTGTNATTFRALLIQD